MVNTGKAKRPKAGKLLAKPKRPMSAYNFFFRAERAKILAKEPAELQSGHCKKLSFEDVGRLIGQRWRAIDSHELAKFKQMAKEDNDRYRDQMKGFYEDELTLMCLGKSDVVAGAGTEKQEKGPSDGAAAPPPLEAWAAGGWGGAAAAIDHPVAAGSARGVQKHLGAATSSDQGPMPMPSALMFANQGLLHANGQQGPSQPQPADAQTSVPAAAGMHFIAAHPPAPMPVPDTTPSFAQPSEDQMLQLLVQQQQSRHTTIPNNTVMALILSLKASVQQREQKLVEERKGLQLRGALLDKMLAHEMGQSSAELLLQQMEQQRPANGGPERRAPADGAAQPQALHLSNLCGNNTFVAPPTMQEVLHQNNEMAPMPMAPMPMASMPMTMAPMMMAAAPPMTMTAAPMTMGMAPMMMAMAPSDGSQGSDTGVNQQGNAMITEEMLTNLSAATMNKNGAA